MLDLDNEQNITNWKARGVPAYMVGQVAVTLVVEREWLEGKDAPMRTESTERFPCPPAANDSALYVLEPLAPWDSDTPLEDDEVELRLYKEVELSSGPGKVARTEVQEITGPKLRFSRATMRTCGVDPSNAVFATNSGNSNHPLILSGATVGIDKGMTRIIDGEIYAIDHDGHFRIKFLQRLPNGIRMRSFNSMEYIDEEYDFEEILAQRIVILGRIFWWSSIRPLKGQPLI
ncbi:helix-turn-helix transcriptional regulator [Pseudomonas sichuanensis]|uniref:S24 family peptidase n=1 Tax=Pseudomonas sichuanensis TaxID=2213015 RepID=UPI0038265A75